MFQCEDEWSEIRQRFKKEGLDVDTLKLEDRLLQVWRWLVDAESNLRNSRRMLDKLYEQQHEEIEVGNLLSYRDNRTLPQAKRLS